MHTQQAVDFVYQAEALRIEQAQMTAANLVVSGHAYAGALAVLARHPEPEHASLPNVTNQPHRAWIMRLTCEVVKAAPLGRQLAPARLRWMADAVSARGVAVGLGTVLGVCAHLLCERIVAVVVAPALLAIRVEVERTLVVPAWASAAIKSAYHNDADNDSCHCTSCNEPAARYTPQCNGTLAGKN